MGSATLNSLAFALYAATIVAIATRTRRKTITIDVQTSLLWLGALGCHALGVSQLLFTDAGLNLAFFKAGSAVAWLIAALLWLHCLQKPLLTISLAILPVIAAAALLGEIDGRQVTTSNTTVSGIHIFTSLLAYSVLGLCGVQAIMLYLQNRKLRGYGSKALLQILPPLDTMELFLFNLLVLGFALLSVSLLTGWIDHQDLLAQHLMHKTVLSGAAWLVFALLLGGHALMGWRGDRAAKLTLTGFGLLIVGYFGSKFVLEYILQRA